MREIIEEFITFTKENNQLVVQTNESELERRRINKRLGKDEIKTSWNPEFL